MNYLRASAEISDCGKYRYSLHRAWNDDLPACLFIMLNPSTADGENDDPTIRKCVKFAQSWDYGVLDVVNLFAFRATEPAVILRDGAGDIIGPNNDATILHHAKQADLIVLAWGAHGHHRQRDEQVEKALRSAGESLHAIALGDRRKYPRHPLYLKDCLKPIVYSSPKGQ